MRALRHSLGLTLLIASGGLAAAAFGGMFFETGPDRAIFPPQDIPIYFPHNYHVRKPNPNSTQEGEGLKCTFCHENVGESKLSGDRDIPGHDACDSCHDEWIGDEDEPAAVADCARCHRDLTKAAAKTESSSIALVPRKMSVPAPNLIFPHDRHVQKGVKCIDCHRRVPLATVATRADFPTMDRCVTCHEKEGVSTECSTCHLTKPSGRLHTKFASGELKPKRFHLSAIHSGDFLRNHAVPAQQDKEYCASCHSQSDCLQCHDGIGRDVRYHPGDWIATHYLRARKDDYRCQSCHRLQSFCLDCHVRSGVATAGPTTDPTQRRTIRRTAAGIAAGPHPMSADGWLDPGSRNFHGFHAQRNIKSCASCHQEQYCVTCHGSAFGGSSIGGNPHGPNPERLKGSTASLRTARACLKCHHPADENWR